MDPLASGFPPQVPANAAGIGPSLGTGTAFDDLAALAAELAGGCAGFIARRRGGGLELIGGFGANAGCRSDATLPPEIAREPSARWVITAERPRPEAGSSAEAAREAWMGVPLLDAAAKSIGALGVRIPPARTPEPAENVWVSLERLARQAVRLLEAGEAQDENRRLLEQAHRVGRIGSWNAGLEAEGTITWSDETARIFGLEPGQFDGRLATFLDRVLPDDRQSFWLASRQAVEQERHFALEYRIRRPDGAIRWIHQAADVERNQDGHPVRLVGIVQDVTELKETEAAFRASVAGTTEVGEAFFTAVVRELARGLKVRYAIVGVLLPGPTERIRTVAVFASGQPGANFEYDLAGTPCAKVVGHRLCHFPHGVAEQFPDDRLLADMRIQSYLGAPLFSNDGRPLGLLAVLHDRPLPFPQTAYDVLQLFSSRAAAELERIAAEECNRQLRRMLEVTGDVNQTIIRSTNPTEILDAACRLAVERGGFRLAWAGRTGVAGQRVSVAAQAGADEPTVRLINAIFAEEPQGCGCEFTETALTTGLATVCNDIANDSRCLPWRDEALRRGYRALCSLPLRVGDRVIGCFNLYADRADFFIPAEVELLSGLAEDISFGLEMCEREQHRAGTEAALRTAHNRFRALVHDVDAIVWEADPRTLGFTFVSNRAEQLLGYPMGRWLDDSGFRIRHIHPEDREAARRFYSVRGLAEGDRHFEHRMLSVEGHVMWLHDHVTAEFVDGELVSLRGLLVDVTARREAELQLRQLSSVVEQSTETILVTDRNGIIQYANRTFKQVSGYTLEELRGQTPRLISSGKMPRKFFERLWRTVLEGNTFSGEFVNRRRNGEIYHAEQTIASLRNEAGRVTHFVSVGRDITVQKRAERAMRDEQALNQTLLENLAGLFVVITRGGQILRWNVGLELAVGVGGDVIRRTHPLELVHPADRALAEKAITRAFAEGTAQVELQVQDASGKAAPYYFVARTTELNEQTVLVGLGFDLRDRRQAEAEIRRLAAFPALNPEPVVEFAADGTLTYRNRASDALTREVGVGEFAQLLPPNAAAILAECIASNQPRLRLETIFGEHTLSWSFFPIGEQRRVHAYVSDITERVRREALARRSQRLESIGTLAGGIAHDLNNTLTPITMGIQMFRHEHPGESLLADTIEQCALRAANMVRQLVTFARGTTGKRVPVEVWQLVRELELILGSTFPKNIRLSFSVAGELPAVVGDPTQLHQLLLNLCVNARDAMPQGGTLYISAQFAEVGPEAAAQMLEASPGQFVRLMVTDTGTGIAPAHLDRIFDPFFTTKSADRGTGLGLANSLGIVRGHNGFINVQSVVGQGSTFEVYLPMARLAPLAAPAAEAAKLPQGRGQLILFVDDERPVARVAGRLLKHLNYHPVIAHSGLEGLERAREHGREVAAVITDLHMPGMDGLEFARELRQLMPDVPMMVASGRLEEPVAAAFEQIGVTLRLDKPFTSPQMAELLAKALLLCEEAK